ncbi:MAG: cyclopropane-fatty-acyl-phospholipid synthase family protein [Thermoanaerobaculia bacterium]
MNVDTLVASGVLPDFVLRMGIRRLLRQRLAEETAATPEAAHARRAEFMAILRSSPLAVEVDAANEQHYELPTSFFQGVLGSHLKYSSGLWEGATSLDEAESAMLALTCERAQLHDGQDVLELGCGWGSLSLWMAEHYPSSTITAVSNSRTQKLFLDAEIARRGIANLRIVTADMRTFDPGASFDRIVSVEMFEHMRNYELLLQRVGSWLRPDGRLFVHIFTHGHFSYLFEPRNESDWMSRYFFSGGMMPASDLLPSFDADVHLLDQWTVNGRHYQQTAESWLRNMDAHRATLQPLIGNTYGAKEARRWWNYWRVFFLSCAELWGFRNGEEWQVTHYLFAKA